MIIRGREGRNFDSGQIRADGVCDSREKARLLIAPNSHAILIRGPFNETLGIDDRGGRTRENFSLGEKWTLRIRRGESG